ncbi:hypothetical protein [Bradyrhizobium sp. Tv2a-2]|uniref:hypothetical protein n=1 Tax=Bradyrhizobium sp. Tv2a-2 TaxID=113395 RepID=UPI0005693494|nr:hypothetical protein [Bradyrhizobium sp. Tv2a-2]
MGTVALDAQQYGSGRGIARKRVVDSMQSALPRPARNCARKQATKERAMMDVLMLALALLLFAAAIGYTYACERL